MIEIKTIGVTGLEGAVRGARMPYESHSKSDSSYRVWTIPTESGNFRYKEYEIGEADLALLKKLVKGGSEHRKFLRMIHVQFEVRMPRYVALEMDTYKVSTVKNSSSTMHLITKRPLTLDDFSYEEEGKEDIEQIIAILNRLIDDYNTYSKRPDEEKKQGKKRGIFRRIKQLLPEGFMQTAIYDMNYETLLSIYHQRKNHRLSEWSGEGGFCEWIINLPYMGDFIEALEGGKDNGQSGAV